MKIVWNAPGERLFETGVSNGVLYPKAGPGVAWNGLVTVDESSTGGEVENLFYNGVKYLDVVASEDYSAVVEALSAPPEFNASDGIKALAPGLFVTQQPRKTFGFSYRTLIGNDTQGPEYGYKLHIVWNATAAPSGITYKTLSGTPALDPRSWTLHCVPPPASTHKPTAHYVIDSTESDPYLLENIETILYGRDDLDPRLPSQAEILSLFSVRVTEFVTEFI